jgi:DNA mismatch repair ATPase MutS
MAFVTDAQTLEDLSIFGRHGGDSIYGLFNRTMTRQGSAVLEDMLRHPLSDGAAIGTRSAIFQSFRVRKTAAGEIAARETPFPFRSELFDVAEAYLAVTDERTRLSGDTQTLGSKMASLIAEDNEYKNIYKGVTALMEILQQLQTFVAGATPEAYGEEKAVILSLLAEGELQPLLTEDLRSKLPYSRVASYDTVIRFRHRGAARRLLQYVYRLDAYLAVCRVAAERGFVFPVVLPPGIPGDRQRVLLEGVYHPQVKNAVANTVQITGDQPVIFLTGANMAGKSTFMKSLGISLFLAHAGFPVPARRMEFSVLDGIYTTINLPDNLGMGASHFYAEVLRVKKVAAALGQGRRLFVIFDELFRGTNVKDAYEATVALTSAFARRRDSFFVISTHIIEAGEVLTAEDAGIRPLYLPTRMKGNQPVYTYQLEEGITADRHGMIIINNEGIPEMLRAGIGAGAGRPGGAGAESGGGASESLDRSDRGFEADQQTLADLNLTGKYRPGSIFSLFNQVKTAGGERLLEEMFSRPLGDAEEINRRVNLLQDLQRRRLTFPFTRPQLGRVEDYLHAGAGGRLATMTYLIRLKLLAVVVKDERYAVVAEGVRAVMDFILDCRRFFQAFEGDEGPWTAEAGPWAAEVREAREILGDARLGELPLDGMSSGMVARYHYLFGHVLHREIGQLCVILYEMDLGIAVGDVGRERGFTWGRARRAEDNVFHAADLRHPGLDRAVGNRMAFSGDSNVLFLTGANMAGKSTLMKSFGIAVYLAHMGFPVAAKDMEFSVREGLYSSINVPDDLSQGYSHFYAEVLRVKKVAEAVSAGRNLVVIFDELFKGTNVKDAYDATLSVTEALAAYSRCWFVISTHIIEVGETLRQRSDNLQFAYLPTVMDGMTPRYPYILEKGITNDRHGMLIIGNEGILDILSAPRGRRDDWRDAGLPAQQ